MKQVTINEFLPLAWQCPVIDVRSPGEYAHAHFPGAYNLPLFSDEERMVVGIAYKQQGREQAIKIGLDYFGVKMRRMVEETGEIVSKCQKANLQAEQLPTANRILVHCWRGGMRSAGVAWLLDLYGFKVYTLAGGYKSFRNWVLRQFEKEYSFKILGGYTGSGKTEVLKQLERERQPIIDLEAIAHHKGSAFGGIGQPTQPTQEMFENVLALNLQKAYTNAAGHPIWLEDESSRIGSINLPQSLWKTIRQSPIRFLDVPFEERLNYIVGAYGQFEKKELADAIMRIKKRLGGQNTKDALSHILEGNTKESFRILLRYYDKYYAKGLPENNELLSVIPCENVDVQTNTLKLTDGKIRDNGTRNK